MPAIESLSCIVGSYANVGMFCVRSRRSSGKGTGSGKLAWLSVARVQPMPGLSKGRRFRPLLSILLPTRMYYVVCVCVCVVVLFVIIILFFFSYCHHHLETYYYAYTMCVCSIIIGWMNAMMIPLITTKKK